MAVGAPIVTMGALPPDVLLPEILQVVWGLGPTAGHSKWFCTVLPCVSKAWEAACRLVAIQIQITIIPEIPLGPHEALVWVMKRFPKVNHLHVCQEGAGLPVGPCAGALAVPSGWFETLQHLSLKGLTLCNCAVGWQVAAALITKSADLEYLVLTSMQWGGGPFELGDLMRGTQRGALPYEELCMIGGGLCSAITNRQSTLTSLDISMETLFDDIGLAALINKLPHLKSLSLAGTHFPPPYDNTVDVAELYEPCFYEHPGKRTMAAISHLPNLHHLDVSAYLPDMGIWISNSSLWGLRKCTALQSLCFGAKPPSSLAGGLHQWSYIQGSLCDPARVVLLQHDRSERVNLQWVCRLLQELPRLVVMHGDGAQSWAHSGNPHPEWGGYADVFWRIRANQ